jgi:hypothetical protein
MSVTQYNYFPMRQLRESHAPVIVAEADSIAMVLSLPYLNNYKQSKALNNIFSYHKYLHLEESAQVGAGS